MVVLEMPQHEQEVVRDTLGYDYSMSVVLKLILSCLWNIRIHRFFLRVLDLFFVLRDSFLFGSFKFWFTNSFYCFFLFLYFLIENFLLLFIWQLLEAFIFWDIAFSYLDRLVSLFLKVFKVRRVYFFRLEELESEVDRFEILKDLWVFFPKHLTWNPFTVKIDSAWVSRRIRASGQEHSQNADYDDLRDRVFLLHMAFVEALYFIYLIQRQLEPWRLFFFDKIDKLIQVF